MTELTVNEKKIPQRRCIGCMQSFGKEKLVRIACFDGKVTVDESMKHDGRGAYICRNSRECEEKAFKRNALERTFGIKLSKDEKQQIFDRIREICG